MSADTHYIDLTPEKCISIPDRHILIKKYKSDESYYQDRPINPIESVLTDLIVGYRSEIAQLRSMIRAEHMPVGYDIADDATTELAVQCAKAERRIAELEEQLKTYQRQAARR